MTIIRETVDSLQSAKAGAYEVTILAEGRGSSGIYTRESIDSGLDVFKAGTPSFFSHAEPWDIPNRNVRTDLAGKIIESWIDVTDRGRHSLRGKFQPSPEHADFFDFFHEQIALSISASGRGYEQSDGTFVVEGFDGSDPLTSVDVVFKGGIDIAGFDRKLESANLKESTKIRISESAKTIFSDADNKTPVAPAVESKDKKGDILTKEELTEALEPMLKMLEGLVAEKQAEVDAEANADAVKSAVTEALAQYESRVKAIEEADLLDPQIEELKERAKTEDVADAIAKAKLVAEAA